MAEGVLVPGGTWPAEPSGDIDAGGHGAKCRRKTGETGQREQGTGNREHVKPSDVLIVEPRAADRSRLARTLGKLGLTVRTAGKAGEALDLVEAGANLGAVFTELILPDLDGLEFLTRLSTLRPLLPVVVLTSAASAETAIEATKRGAYDYLLKPWDEEELEDAARCAVGAGQKMNIRVAVGQAAAAERDILVGASRAMQTVYKELGRVAAKPVTVLIRGETGSGKELVARALYQHGHRAHMPFVAVNCAAIPETLLESELFGHEKGSFTGAESRRIGRFEQAHNGTIFLDEIGELTPGTQAKLLRVLQERSLQRLGGREEIPVDVRVIAATNADLERAIERREFRADLYYRLNAVTIALPPLRERRDDVPLLTAHFLSQFAAELGMDTPIEKDAIELLVAHPWPGNVRQLQNVLRQAVLRARGFPIDPEIVRTILDESPHPRDGAGLEALIARRLGEAAAGLDKGVHAELMREFERELFTRAIRLARGNLSRAARWLGLSRMTVREKLAAFGLRGGKQDGDP